MDIKKQQAKLFGEDNDEVCEQALKRLKGDYAAGNDDN